LLIAIIVFTVVFVLGSVLITFVHKRFVIDPAVRMDREVTFRNTLRRWGCSEHEIEKAVKRQGW